MKPVSRNKDKGSAIERYIKSFFHAIDGIVYAIKYEHNMIIILIAIIVTTLAGLYFEISLYEWLFCILVFGLVAGTELINSAIEAIVDLETTKYHPLAKIAKDTASSATLIFCFVALIGAIIIFGPKIMNIIETL